MDERKAELTQNGWKVEEMEADDGCYEVEGTNQSGQRVEAKFNPETFEMIKSERDD